MKQILILVFVILTLSFLNVGSKTRPKDPELSKSQLTEDLAKGKELFKYNCRACHRWYYRFAAPAWQDVLPAYAKGDSLKQDSLIGYIETPYVINPEEYPPMDAPELVREEAELVAEYILELYRVQSEK